MNKQKEVQSDRVGQQNVPQKKKDIKTTLRNLLALVLVAAVSIVGTLAFLSDDDGKRVNTFTGSAGIQVTLTEDKWTAVADDIAQGEELAANYTPGMVIPKNPTLKNTSTSACDEWVAIRVDYKYGSATATKGMLEALVIQDGISINSGWYKLNTKVKDTSDNLVATDYDIYIYNNKLAQNETATLFDQIKIKDQKTLETQREYDGSNYTVFSNNKYTDFEITVFGAAIKNDASIASGISNINFNYTITNEDNSTTDMAHNIINYEINMSDLATQITNLEAEIASTTAEKQIKDSKRIALALANLLKTLPN